jgi:transcription initiation factor TFIIB
MITSNIHSCNFCNSENTIITDFSAGEIVCSNCGVVIDDKIIDETLETRRFSSENGNGGEDNNRVGGPSNPYLNEVTLSTKISVKDKKNPINKYSYRSFESGDRSIIRGLDKIEELGTKLELLLSVVNKSKDVYKVIISNKKLKGRSLDGIIAAIFYHVCRQSNANRSLQDVINRLKIDKKEFVRCFKSIEPLMTKEHDKGNIENTVGLATVFSNKLDFEGKFRSACETVTRSVCEQELLAGRNPNTVAAACILFTSHLLNPISGIVNKTNLCNVSNMTFHTITISFNEIMKRREEIIPFEYKHLLGNLKDVVI